MAGPRLLIIDDDPRIGRLIGRIARQIGLVAEFLLDGERIEPFCEEFRPTVVVVDIILGHRTGNDVLRTLSEFGLRPAPVVVLISGADADRMDAARDLAEELGIPVVASLPKPLDVGIMTNELRRAVAAAEAASAKVA